MDKLWAIIATVFAVVFGLFRYEKRRADKLDEKSRTNEALSDSKANSFSHIQKQLKEAQDEATGDTLNPDTDYRL